MNPPTDREIASVIEQWEDRKQLLGPRDLANHGEPIEVRLARALAVERRQREALSDETPISPAFVDSLGFEYFIPDADGWNAEIAFEHGETRTEVLWWSDGTCIIAQGEDESIRIPGKVTTCGQLRHLLAALKPGELEATMKGNQ